MACECPFVLLSSFLFALPSPHPPQISHGDVFHNYFLLISIFVILQTQQIHYSMNIVKTGLQN